jgi:hypothetical protein
VFNTNNLQLTGTLTAGTHATLTASGTIGNVTKTTSSFTASDCGMANTSGVTVGQLFFQIFSGFHYVTGNNGTTITTSPSTAVPRLSGHFSHASSRLPIMR